MAVGGRHQGDQPTHRVEADPAEAPAPVDGGERGDGVGVGVQDVEGGAEGSGMHRGRRLHGGRLVLARAGPPLYRPPPAEASPGARVGNPAASLADGPNQLAAA